MSINNYAGKLTPIIRPVVLPLIIQSQFDQDIWQKCCQHVFGDIK